MAIAPSLVLSTRRGDLGPRDHARQAGHLGNVEEDEEGAFNRRGHVQLGERQVSEGVGDGDATEGQSASAVAQDHDPLAIPTINVGTRGETEHEIRETE